MGVQPFVALQADQVGAQRLGQALGDLGLADAGIAFQQQRPLQPRHQHDRHGQRGIGHIAGPGQSPHDLVPGEFHRSLCHGRRPRIGVAKLAG